MYELETDREITRVLSEAKVVAVLGANTKQEKAAYYVPDYLHDKGYTILPVNPVHAGKPLFGQTVSVSLGELREPIDIVDVFRRSEALPAHLEEILAMHPLPKVVWLQLGIRNNAFAGKLLESGINVVQDHCMLAEHKRLLGPGHPSRGQV